MQHAIERQLVVKEQIIETSLVTLAIRNEGYVEMRFKSAEYIIEKRHIVEMKKAYGKLTAGGRKRYSILVLAGPFGTISKEAQEMEVFAHQEYNNLRSLAIVVPTLHKRLLGLLFFRLKKKKPSYPYKLFSSEIEAQQWLNKPSG